MKRERVVEHLTEEQRARLHERWDSVLGAEEVERQIELALDHKAAQKYTKMYLYCGNWLRKEALRKEAMFGAYQGYHPQGKPLSSRDRSPKQRANPNVIASWRRL